MLRGLGMMHIHDDEPINLDGVVRRFCMIQPRRMGMFDILSDQTVNRMTCHFLNCKKSASLRSRHECNVHVFCVYHSGVSIGVKRRT